jgi:hypothetical protein
MTIDVDGSLPSLAARPRAAARARTRYISGEGSRLDHALGGAARARTRSCGRGARSARGLAITHLYRVSSLGEYTVNVKVHEFEQLAESPLFSKV